MRLLEMMLAWDWREDLERSVHLEGIALSG